MYLHIGAGRMIRSSSIIGCFDLDGRVSSEVTKAFLKNEQRRGRTSSAGEDLPRAFVLTDDGVIFTHISANAVAGRG